MNIAVLSYHRVGGSGVVAYEIGSAMACKKGHTVHFLGLEPPFRFGENGCHRLRFHRIDLFDCPVFDFTPYILAMASQLSDVIREYDIDVIHSHYALPHAVAAQMARDMSGRKAKCVTTLHGTDVTMVGSHPSMKNVTRHTIENSDVVTAVSHYLRNEAEKTFGVSRGKIQTVYNFVNTRFFNPELKGGMNVDKKGRDVVLHMSNLRPVKAPLDVVRIFHGIDRRLNRPLELWVVGEGPMESEMTQLAASLGIDDRVRFFGARKGVGPLIANADLFLLPSEQESFGLAALEAMACGVPVVATSAGGLPEVIDDGVSGLLFEKGNVDDAVEKATRLLSDTELHKNIRDAGLKSVVEKFNLDRIVQEYEDLYRSSPNCPRRAAVPDARRQPSI